MDDSTEEIRREMCEVINGNPQSRGMIEEAFGQVWDTEELSRDFDVLGFMAPFVVARRKSDRKQGSLMFQHYPRFYFDWQEESNGLDT